ncbi:MAG: diaminopimelate decarboxylase [Synergistes sp.]|nr:diaminopimelate decarboxylase [Synergistes sp.]
MFINRDEAYYLAKEFGTPLYVYSEDILRQRCRDLFNAFGGRLLPSFSIKANSNLTLLKIVREEGITADAMSPGEIFVLEHAGYSNKEIFFVSNNVSPDEMKFAADKGILTSVDSISQLETFGRVNRGGHVALRFNPGVGAGHCDKVITGGHKTKFGVDTIFLPQVREILKKYDLTLVGINQHIGSLFFETKPYVDGVINLLEIAKAFPGLEFVDFGGGFGVPYRDTEPRFDLNKLADEIFPLFDRFISEYDNKDVKFKCEPGRFLSAECGYLIGSVHATKDNYGHKYVGTDVGFSVLMRPMLYDAYHKVNLIKKNGTERREEDAPLATLVGNICESGDIFARNRHIGDAEVGDLVVVENAGAYGYSMASNYNCRMRPAEVLKTSAANFKLIRKADRPESLIENF